MADNKGRAQPPDQPQSDAPVDEPSLLDQVEALADALHGSNVSELDLEEGGLRITIRRHLEPMVVLPQATSSGPAHPGPAEAPAPEEHTVAVLAPLTGIFYAASSPSLPPIVEVGGTVQAGEVVCIVEAMKVFNEIKSEISGVVAEIVAQNGQLVQKGQPLIRLKPL